MGPVFKSSSTVIYAHADAAFGVHTDGFSSSAHFLSVGETNAPFVTVAKVQLEVASCPMTSEYVSANNACKSIMHARQLSEQLGWSQPATPFMLDNKTSINLATAPEITRKAKHILQYHHYIRDLYRQRLLRFLYVASPANWADVLTKLFSRMSFQRGAHSLLNRASLP